MPRPAIQLLGMDPVYMNNFVLLAMAGYFAAIVRAPLTGIILIFEMTGSLSQMLSLSIVSVTAYITATLLHSRPIYESLLERLLAQGRGAGGLCARTEGAAGVCGRKRERPGRRADRGCGVAKRLPDRSRAAGRKGTDPQRQDDAADGRRAGCP